MKLKPKYKWSNRFNHLATLNRRRELHGLYGDPFLFGLKSLQQYEPLGLLTILKDKFPLGIHWTKEEIDKIRNSTCISKVSALEKEGQYDQPADKNISSHTFDDFPLVYRDGKEHFKITLAEDE